MNLVYLIKFVMFPIYIGAALSAFCGLNLHMWELYAILIPILVINAIPYQEIE